MPGNEPRFLGRPGHSLILTPNALVRPQSTQVRKRILFNKIIKPLQMIKSFYFLHEISKLNKLISRPRFRLVRNNLMGDKIGGGGKS